jgi:hypothetical protein
VSSEVAEAESRLADQWIRAALGPDVQVVVGTIADAPPSSGTSVTLMLLHIAPAPRPRTTAGIQPLLLRARYLVTIAAPDRAAERQALAELAFAAGPSTEVELEATAPGPELWQSLGVRVRPALCVSVLLQRERLRRPVPRVRQPLITRFSPSRPLVGVVVGPGDAPIAGALVEVEGLAQSTYSNHRGEFAFRSVPAAEPLPTLVVRAKGTSVRVRVQDGAPESAPLVIRVPLSES